MNDSKKIVLVHCRPPEQARSFSSLPLGILYLSAVLKNKGYADVHLLDHSFEPFDSIVKKIEQFKPEFVCLSAMSAYFSAARNIGEYIKKNTPALIVLGGPHASIMRDDDFAKEPWIDILLRGEGEMILPDIIENSRDLPKVRGISYRQNGAIHSTPAADLIKDLDSIPFPDLDSLPSRPFYLDRRRYSLLTARGCPFRCTYCQPGLSNIWGKGVRFRSPENIIKEIRMVKDKYGINDISFLDDTLTLNPQRLSRIMELLKPESIVFDINTRVDCLTDEMAAKLKEAGCSRISFGVESGSQYILDEDFKKGITVQQIKDAFKICRLRKIETKAYIMVGSIHDTPATLAETKRLIDEIQPDYLSFSIVTPFPGTELYQTCKDSGLLNLFDERMLDFRSFAVDQLPIKNQTLTYKDVKRWIDKIMRGRRLKFLLKGVVKTLTAFIKKPSLQFLIRSYKDFRKLGYIG